MYTCATTLIALYTPRIHELRHIHQLNKNSLPYIENPIDGYCMHTCYFISMCYFSGLSVNCHLESVHLGGNGANQIALSRPSAVTED